MIETNSPTSAVVKKRFSFWVLFWLLIGFACLSLTVGTVGVYILNQAPSQFSEPVSVEIELGTTVKAITRQLEEASVIRSGTLLYFVITLFYDPMDIKASRYVFTEPLTATDAAKRLVAGDFDSDLVRLTHIEGERVTVLAEVTETNLLNFDKAAFIARATPLEGRLYPETYYIPKDFSADELIDLMLQTFTEKTESIQVKMKDHPFGPDGVLILASILEREAN